VMLRWGWLPGLDLRATPLPCMQLLGIWVRERV